MGVLFKKDFKSSFNNMTAEILIAFILLIFGIFTGMYNLNYNGQNVGYSQFEYTISSVASFLSMIIIPVITVRSFSEEKRAKTDGLLYSLPIKTPAIVIAKYFAMVAVFAIPVVIIGLYPFVLKLFGTVHLMSAYSTLIAFFLLGCALIAVGMFISSLTENPIIAAVFTIGAIFLAYFSSNIATTIDASASTSYMGLMVISLLIAVVVYLLVKNIIAALIIGVACAIASTVVFIVKSSLLENLIPSVISKFSLFQGLEDFSYGVFNVSTVIFYISIAVFFTFLTVLSFEKKRWN